MQAFGRVRELPFVNQQPRVHAAFEHGAIDLIERHHLGLEVRVEELQGQKRGRQAAGNGNPHALEGHGPAAAPWLPRHEDRTVPVAHARAVRQQRVPIHQVRVGMERHGGDFVLPVERRAVERLDIGEHLFDVDAFDAARRRTPDHRT